MVDLPRLLTIGVSAFAATNIDDIFVLMILFSSLSFPVSHVVLGQYVGIGLLIAISVLGFTIRGFSIDPDISYTVLRTLSQSIVLHNGAKDN